MEFDGTNQIDRNPESFKGCCVDSLLNDTKRFERSIHFSTEDICPSCTHECYDCKDKLYAYFIKNGSFVDMSERNKIGRGGFGMVFVGQWKKRQAAIKCVRIMDMQRQKTVRAAFQDLRKNIEEYRKQLASSGSGILIPHAVLRQQNQSQDQNGLWKPYNYNIFVYDRYECNLYQFHRMFFGKFTNKTLLDLLRQCLTRKSQYKIQTHINHLISQFHLFFDLF